MISKFIVRTGWFLHARMLMTVDLQLSRMPKIAIGTHKRRGKEYNVLRLLDHSNGKAQWREFSISSQKGKTHLSTYRKIAYLKKILAELASDDREITDMISKTEDYRNKCMCSMPGDQKKSGDFTFSLEEWNNLRELKDQTIKNGYRHRDHLFRSKSEMLVAQILDSLGLEYKYEPVVIINGLERHPDFAVYCPEAGRYFFIEHLGCMDDPKYRYDNLVKVEMYEKAGIRNGIDIIYNTEFGRGNFTTAAVLGKIIGLLFAQNSSVLL